MKIACGIDKPRLKKYTLVLKLVKLLYENNIDNNFWSVTCTNFLTGFNCENFRY